MNKYKIIGIGGFAQVGKDSLFIALKKINNLYYRVALADGVKKEVRQVIKDAHNIDIFNCTPQEKEQVREILVNYATIMRDDTGGMYWLDKIKEPVEEAFKNNLIPVITDVRYKNEAEHIKSLGGIVIHLKKYSYIDGLKVYTHAANKTEEENDPQVQELADIKLEWQDGLNKEEMVSFANDIINKL